jgi:serpin B
MMDGLKTGNEMSGRSDCELTIANSIWCQSGYPFNHSFLELMRDNFRAEVFQLDFANGDERARNEINSWADKKTHGHLKALIGQGVLDGNTRLVLVNAIHFKAAWGMPFDKRMTKTEPFYAGGEQGVAAPFMCSDDNIEAGLESDDLQLLELPYSDPKLVIDILLPKNRTGLKPLEERLSAANMNKWFSELEEYSPQIELPRLKLAGLVNLHSALAAMGIRDLFDPGRADLSGISSAHKLYASHLAQGAYVAIDENGTEADATTAVEIKMLTRGRPMQFKADHPFVFAIRNRATGAILLLGRLVNPAE